MMDDLKIIITDDHALFREGLVFNLQTLGSGQTQIYEASTAAEAFIHVRNQDNIDLILMDLELPDMHGFDALAQLRQTAPDIPVVILSGTQTTEAVNRSMHNGAAGFICKSSNSKELLTALRTILDGGSHTPVVHETINAPAKESSSARKTAANEVLPGRLTPRQREVLQFIAEGLSNKEIAQQLGMAEGTVKIHVTAILKELQANNRTQAVVLAKQSGIIDG